MQSLALPALHLPPEQTSPTEHALLSVHALALALCVQASLLQPSSVQGLLSLQSLALPALHLPAEQASPIVQPLPSLHALATALCEQVLPVQASLVQTFLSSQLPHASQMPPPGPPPHHSQCQFSDGTVFLKPYAPPCLVSQLNTPELLVFKSSAWPLW